jgi:hypothetical protein
VRAYDCEHLAAPEAVVIAGQDSWGMSVSGCKNCARDAFYAWVIPPEIAQAEIARDRTGI